jgi:hypothetical protein
MIADRSSAALIAQNKLDARAGRGTCGQCMHSRMGTQGMFNNPHLMCTAHPPRAHVMPVPKAPQPVMGPDGKLQMGPPDMGFNLTGLYPIVDRDAGCGEYRGQADS